jgi:hypothetical protein
MRSEHIFHKGDGQHSTDRSFGAWQRVLNLILHLPRENAARHNRQQQVNK